MGERTYAEMYGEAVAMTADEDGICRYKGCTGANALSLYVYEKYSVNAAGDYAAHDALVEALNA